MGRTGKLDFSIDKVRTTDGAYLPLRYMQKREGVSTGVITAGVAVVFWPVAPAVAPANPNTLQFASAAQPGIAAPAGLASVSVTSDLQGAEVEVDGSFVGSTPSTVRMAAGTHKITVRHGRSVWSRDLNVQPGGTVNVNAILKQQ